MTSLGKKAVSFLAFFWLIFLLSSCTTFNWVTPNIQSVFPTKKSTNPLADQSYSPADPLQVALLLPMSGKLASSGEAIRSGFMAAFYDASNTLKPKNIEVYNTANGNVLALYNKAVNQGANLVIGPLTKEEVQAIKNMGKLPVTTVALNQLSANSSPVKNLYEYALSPLDEASQAAITAHQQGYSRALLIIPADRWGSGIEQVFSQTFTQQGGTIIDTLRYSNSTDLDPAIQKVLKVNKPKKNSDPLTQSPLRRQDIDMIFLVATPQKARLINPLLKFYYAETLPVFATAQIYSGQSNPLLDKDLNGIFFCDTPWVLNRTAAIRSEKSQMIKLVPNIRGQNIRLYAFGLDAYQVAMSIKQQNSRLITSGLEGVTGTLFLQPNHQIVRQLTCAQFQGGLPRL